MPLDKADSKVQEICNILRKETLEPAQYEARKIIDDARVEADEMVRKAKEEVIAIFQESKKTLAQELRVQEGSIQLAIRQGISALKQGVEKMFSRELHTEVEQVMKGEDLIAKAVGVILHLIEKEGLGVDLRCLFPKHVNMELICDQLIGNFAEKVKTCGMQIADIKGGVEVKIMNKKMSIDMTDGAVKELLASYVIPELRERIFCEG